MQECASIIGVDRLVVEDRPGRGIEHEQPVSLAVRDSGDNQIAKERSRVGGYSGHRDQVFSGDDEPAGGGEYEQVEAGRRKDAGVILQRELSLRVLGESVVEETNCTVSPERESQTPARLAGKNETRHRVQDVDHVSGNEHSITVSSTGGHRLDQDVARHALFLARHADWAPTLRKLMPGIESRVGASWHSVAAKHDRTVRIVGVAPRSG